ncbi:carboxypeptidase-like regulatory domain-containing protein [Mariniblastus fucicola]|nr:carboxypeptidase-like regulatory domain-containing protein [Mariniblastus fucicola]
MKFFVPLAICFLLVSLQPGCSDGEEARLPVSGTVTLDGQPLADAKVTLMPKDNRRVANAITDETGRFDSATTFSSGDGALIGEHYVAITPKTPPPMPGDEVSSPGGAEPGKKGKYVAPIPAKYGKPKESGLEVEVARGSDNDFVFELESR